MGSFLNTRIIVKITVSFVKKRYRIFDVYCGGRAPYKAKAMDKCTYFSYNKQDMKKRRR